MQRVFFGFTTWLWKYVDALFRRCFKNVSLTFKQTDMDITLIIEYEIDFTCKLNVESTLKYGL